MKILFVQKVKAFAGSEKYLVEIIPALMARGIDCKFICIVHPDDLLKLDHFKKVIEDKKIPFEFVSAKKDLSFGLLRRLKSIAKSEDYDLIHLNLIHAELWFALIKKVFGLKVKLVSTIHGFDETYQAQYGFDPSKVTSTKYIKILKFTEKKIHKYFAVSKGLHDLVVQGNIIPQSKIRIINYGFDYPEKKNPELIKSDSKIILVPGRLVEYKGQNFALEMLPKLKTKGINAKIQIAGDAQGDFVETLKSKIKELDIENDVEFLGHVSNIDDHYQKCDLVILTSKSEGFGLVLLEAFNHERPVITFDVPAFNTTIKHEYSGLITPCFDTDLLAENAAKILSDDKLSKKLTRNAKKDLLEYYCLNRMVDETVAFYKDALD
ncbi:MAG: glycosyltransferase involved in cell wall biosynthesis [Arenicella sp.]|jgi:glycosyltransferase involved in cell wall biosynthesis